MEFSQILEDAKTFGDDISLEINGQKVTLGDIRGLTKKQQQALSEKMADTERKRTEVMQLAEQAANLKNSLEAQIAEVNKRVTPSANDDFENDPFWAPVRKQLSGPQETIKELKGTVKQLTDSVTKIAGIWADDRWQSQYERAKPRLKDKAKDWTFEKVRDYAAQNKLVDSHGLPSVEKAIMELTKEDELETIRKEAYERGLREGNTKGRMGVQPKPTSASGGVKQPENSMVAKKGLEGLGDDVASDPELMEMLSNLGAVDPEDFGGRVQ